MNILLRRLRPARLLCLLVLAFAGGAAAQDSDNLTMVGNFGKGEGQSRAVFAQGTVAYYGIGNRVDIADFSNPASPVRLGSLLLPDRVEDIVKVGNFLYVVSGDGLHILNVQNPTQPVEVASLESEAYGEGLAVDPPYVLMADGDAGLRIIDASNPSAPVEIAQVDTLSSYTEGVTYNNGVAYVAAGSKIHLINYSNPASPTYAGVITNPIDWFQSATVRGSYLYVADYGGGFRIFDVSNPAQPVDVGFLDLGEGSETARVTLEGDYAYLSSVEAGVTIVDISDVTNPHSVAVANTAGSARHTAISGTLLYVADQEGVEVYDISDPGNPTFESAIDVLAPAEGRAYSMDFDGDLLYVAYGAAGLRVLDASNPAAMTELAPVLQFVDAGGEVGRARAVEVRDGIAYVVAEGAAVNIVEFNGENLGILGTISPGGATYALSIEGDRMAISHDEGVAFYEFGDTPFPVQRAHSVDEGYSDRVTIEGRYAYAIFEGSRLAIYDLLDLNNVVKVGEVALGGSYAEGRIVPMGDYLYTTNGDGLVVIDISDETAPEIVGTFATSSYAYGVNVLGDYAYVATEDDGVRLVDISDPENPAEVGFADPGDVMRDVVFSHGLIFTANSEAGVTVFENALTVGVQPGREVPDRVVLHQNYPNPFNPSTQIRFDLERPGHVRLEVYTLLGQKAATLVDEVRTAGAHTVPFSAARLGSGTYLYRLQADGVTQVRLMTVLK